MSGWRSSGLALQSIDYCAMFLRISLHYFFFPFFFFLSQSRWGYFEEILMIALLYGHFLFKRTVRTTIYHYYDHEMGMMAS